MLLSVSVLYMESNYHNITNCQMLAVDKNALLRGARAFQVKAKHFFFPFFFLMIRIFIFNLGK